MAALARMSPRALTRVLGTKSSAVGPASGLHGPPPADDYADEVVFPEVPKFKTEKEAQVKQTNRANSRRFSLTLLYQIMHNNFSLCSTPVFPSVSVRCAPWRSVSTFTTCPSSTAGGASSSKSTTSPTTRGNLHNSQRSQTWSTDCQRYRHN